MPSKYTVSNKVENIYSLTPLQEGMLFYNLYNSDSTDYVLQNVFSIEFDLSPQYIESALRLLSKRFSALRTLFFYQKIDKPQQIVLKERKIEFEFIDYTSSPLSDLKEQINKLIKDDVKRNFNLQSDSLLRVKYLKIPNEKSKLILTMHHIITDGWCTAIVYNKFFEYYTRVSNGENEEYILKEIENELSESSAYGDYIMWLEKQDIDKAEKYWENELEGYDSDCEIKAMKKPEPTEEQMRKVFRVTSTELTNKLKAEAERIGSTINIVAETAVGIMLQGYSGSNDVVFGKVVSGRNADITGIENMVGLFINTIPVRVKTEEDETVAELIKEQQKKGAESSNYDYCSLSEIQSKTTQGSELIKVLYVFENYSSGFKEDNNNSYGITVEKSREQTNYGITICGFENKRKLSFEIMYDPKTYCEDEVQIILERLLKICEEMAENPDAKVCDLETVTEQDTLLWKKYNATDEYIPEESLENLVHTQCQKTPDNIAVVCGDERLTYSELWAKVEKVAGYLHSKEYGRNDYIAVSGERSIWTIVNIIGILAAGCAYVPENPEYPEERNQYMYENSKCCQRLDKNSYESENIEKYEPYCCESAPESIAYTIYTSGSTGAPKGVVIKHSAASNTIQDINSKFNVNEKSCIIGLSAYSFDLSVYDIFGTLSTGAKLVIVKDQRDTEEIQKIINKENVTFWNSVPAIMSMYLTSGGKGNDSLRDVLLSGDWIPVTLPKQIRNEFINAKVCSLGGATEGSIWSIYYPIGEVPEGANSIPYGMPLVNQKMLILNAGSKLCPVGAIGEICIAGKGVAEGYANQPEKTAAVFVEHPEYGRIYHTGDIGRMCPDGFIEFMGRLDEQVKIRGFRIELGEIESRIREIENVKECAVIVREDKLGDKAIFAYYTSNGGITAEEIREKLNDTLPEYMVPANMMQIEAIPVTRNGKLDRKALPEIETKSTSEYVAPRNGTEKAICDIFTEILSVEKVGIKDSFFELGGHSLRATRLVNKIEAETGARIALKDVFAHPTPEQLAVLAGAESEEYVPIPKAEDKQYYLMSSAQKRTYLIQQMDHEALIYNLPRNLKLTGKVRADDMRDALQAMVDRHEILRTQFLMIDGEPVQKILAHIEADFEYIESNESDENLISNFIRPFDLSSGKLVRIKLINKGKYHLMMFDMHHIISDGMSMNTFTTELMKSYNGEKLTPLTHQFKDYSEWMRSRDLSGQSEYWKNQFNDEIPVLDMPTDYPRPQEQSYAGTMFNEVIDAELSDKIKQLVKKTGTTEYMVFLAAVMIMLSKYSRQEDIVIGSPISGRTHRDTEEMLGMFVNTLAMRGKPEKNKIFSQFLKEIKETCLKAYENQEYPFEELVEAVDVQRDMSRNPLFDVMLVLQNNENVDIKFGECDVEGTGVKSTIAKFDMTFNICEYEDRFVIGFEYCTDLFKAETANEILKHFEVILNAVTANVEQKIGEIEMVTADEKRLILNDFNATDKDFPRDKTVIELFEEQVKKTPDNIALVFEDKKQTYAEFNARANSLAHKLRKLGIKPDDFVAIISDRSIEMICGVYGIIKAGGAYVPMDPKYPEDRITFMLEDCKPKAVLKYTTKSITINNKIPVINLSESGVWKGESENPEIVNMPENLIYCIYTSGTTGKPKGAAIYHTSFTNLVTWYQSKFDFNENDINLFIASLCFDLGQKNLFTTLIVGGTLVVADVMKDGYDKLSEIIEKNRVTVINCAPSVFNYIIKENSENSYRRLTSLKNVFLGGEPINAVALRNAVESENTNFRIINTYGPTECTDVVSSYSDVNERILDGGVIPIGKPNNNNNILLLNGNDFCGIGVPGELCITGIGVSEKYINKAKLTAEKFVENLYGEGKMYRTGDLARWLPDGNIEFLGRIDEQVKIRGLRIELGEIESRIMEIENINDCAVIARIDSTGEKAIYAYYTSNFELSVFEIRDRLSESLPEYMVPAYMMQIGSIPVTRNGKLDKRALPKIESRTTREYVAPRNKAEAAICEAFSEILNVENVGIYDDFFELGGNSLKAISLVRKLQQCNYQINISDIMHRRSPYYINEGISGKILNSNDLSKDELLGIKIESFAEIEKCIDEQREKYADQLLKMHEVKNVPVSEMQKFTSHFMNRNNVVNIEFNNGLNYNKLNNAVHNVINEQDALRSKLMLNGNELQLVLLENIKEFFLPFIDVSDLGEKAIFYTEKAIDAIEYLNNKKFLSYFLLVKYDKEHYKLYLIISHVVFDGMSGEVVKSVIMNHYYGQNSNGVNSYFEYIANLNESSLKISENELIDRFKLKEFSDLDLGYKVKNIKGILFKRSCFSLEKCEKILSESEIYDITYRLFVNMQQINLNSNNVKFAIMTNGRKYGKKKYYETVGEFIDILPIIEDSSSNCKNEELAELISYKDENCINFLTLINSDEMGKKYPEIFECFDKIRTGKEIISIFNYLGIYEANDNSMLGKEITFDMNNTENIVISSVYFYDNNIYMDLWSDAKYGKAKWLEIEKKLHQYFDQILEEKNEE